MHRFAAVKTWLLWGLDFRRTNGSELWMFARFQVCLGESLVGSTGSDVQVVVSAAKICRRLAAKLVPDDWNVPTKQCDKRKQKTKRHHV